MTKFALLFAWTTPLLGLVAVATANEPGWTDQERLARRDMVCIGKVVSVEKSGPINEREDLYVATIEIAGMKKGPRIATGSKVHAYYEFAKSGKNDRCPTYAELKKGDEATFYLQNLSTEWQVAFGLQQVPKSSWLVEMGSDVKAKADPEP